MRARKKNHSAIFLPLTVPHAENAITEYSGIPISPPRKKKIGSKIRKVPEIEAELQCLTERRKTMFGSNYQEVRKSRVGEIRILL